MRIVCVDGGREWDVEVRFGGPDATLADPAAAVGLPGRVIGVDGRVASHRRPVEIGAEIGVVIRCVDRCGDRFGVGVGDRFGGTATQDDAHSPLRAPGSTRSRVIVRPTGRT